MLLNRDSSSRQQTTPQTGAKMRSVKVGSNSSWSCMLGRRLVVTQIVQHFSKTQSWNVLDLSRNPVMKTNTLNSTTALCRPNLSLSPRMHQPQVASLSVRAANVLRLPFEFAACCAGELCALLARTFEVPEAPKARAIKVHSTEPLWALCLALRPFLPAFQQSIAEQAKSGRESLWASYDTQGLRGFANEKKVWIGGLPAGPTSIETNKKLKEHMAQAGECIFAEINKSGIAGAAYKTPEEVQKAVQMLNGSTFEGHTLEVDVWQKKTPEGKRCRTAHQTGCSTCQTLVAALFAARDDC
eukprot:s419_g37.t1